jgi:steroid delta-isomerase-like uncharacterized protein
MTTQADQAMAIGELAQRYGEAWNSGDLDAILSMHTEDSIFQAHAAGPPAVAGKAAVRRAFVSYFALLPDINFAPRSLHVGSDHWVMQSTMTGTVGQALKVEDQTLGAGGSRIEVDCVDVIEVCDGLVARKDTYLDTVLFQRQLEGT